MGISLVHDDSLFNADGYTEMIIDNDNVTENMDTYYHKFISF